MPWPKDNENALIAYYGRPGEEVESQLVPVVPPFRIVNEGKPVSKIMFHRKAAPALLAALNEIWEAYGKDQNKIDAARVSIYDGAYNKRKISGSDRWSNHAFGFNTGHGTMPQIVIDAFKRQGWRWGGNYKGRTDPMHFEAVDGGSTSTSTSKHPFAELRSEYEHDLSIVKTLPSKEKEIDSIARRLMSGDAISQYFAIQKELGIPIAVQATICERESGADFSKSPAQGDRWDRVSKNVPRNKGPYPSWHAAAVDAWHNIDRLDANTAPWSLPYAMWKQEAFNGLGYRSHGIRSPYILGGTNLQQRGKYVSDGKFDSSVMDTQIGTVPVMLRMIELQPSLLFGPEIPQGGSGSVITPSLPVPESAGGKLPVRGNLTGMQWVQDSLNKLMTPGSDQLDVDGVFGRFTRIAIRKFQESVGIEADGLIDDETCNMIDRELRVLPE
jgi:lysozyme family protein